MRSRRTKTVPQCPRCNSAHVVPIVYGLPTAGLGDQAERGEVTLGGCCVAGDDPEWHCRDCSWVWNARGGREWVHESLDASTDLQ